MGYFFPAFYFSPYVKKYIVERCTKETLGNQRFARSSVIASDPWPLARLCFLHKKWFWIISSFISHSKIQMSVIMEVEGSQEVKILVLFIYLVWNYFGFNKYSKHSKQHFYRFILHHLHIFPPKDRINVISFHCLPHSWCLVSSKWINSVS